ncbi:hypothetical protein [Pleionea litopenaei]|uniref:Uncharacterized protein n=1 Tax=Pleionea litopenaei TaxID=3070815 RepID=A0AA51X773_9GAMM|nr:hypothetical protein [Pleionea sp. HL-JVS1]WMS87624.1 hypothetical protein Q9312_01555 [Pleionea sp. HL-JVS1]
MKFIVIIAVLLSTLQGCIQSYAESSSTAATRTFQCDKVTIQLPKDFKAKNMVSLGWGAVNVCKYVMDDKSDIEVKLSIDYGLKTPEMNFSTEESSAIAKYLAGLEYQFYNNMNDNQLEFSGPSIVIIKNKPFFCTLAIIKNGPRNRHCTYFSNELTVQVKYQYSSQSNLSVDRLDNSIESLDF